MRFNLLLLIRYFIRYTWWVFNFWKFKKMGMFSYINKPLRIDGIENIIIGERVTINYKTWLAAVPKTGNLNPILKIGDGSKIGNFNHIYSTNCIIIGEYVLIADKVYISDNTHSYHDVDEPVINQDIKQIGEVIIGDGSWICESVSIIGAKIGKHCVIGANSVVTKDIPDYCIAVGTPAYIVKRYNFEKQKWEKTNPDGSFKI